MDFQERYNNFKRELRDLKTGHNARSNMRTFNKTITIPSGQYVSKIRLTYADGDQPIMTTMVSLPLIIPLKPNGLTQDFKVANLSGEFAVNLDVSFLSTRKIESIQLIQ